MKITNLGVTELTQNELKTIDGGFGIGIYIAVYLGGLLVGYVLATLAEN